MVVAIQNTNTGVKRSPALCTGLSVFLGYRNFFFGFAFFCAELFFLVGLFFLGSAVFFGIKLNLRLVNYLFGCIVFLPVPLSCPFRSSNCTARLKVNKDMPIMVRTINEQCTQFSFVITPWLIFSTNHIN